MALSSTRRQRIIEFSTPKVADLVVVELKDASKNLSSAGSADDSSYGTPHPDTSKFPDFKLALIKNADDQQGQFQLWYYIKDRAEQDRYNWEFQAAGVGSSRYDSVVRTYVIPRYGSGTDGALGGGQVAGTDVFDESLPAIASTMPSTIHDPFGSGLGNATTPDTNYVLFEKKQVRSGDETLDSLYVVEQRVYVKKVPIRRIDLDEVFDEPLRSKETIFYKDETVSKTTAFGSTDTTSSMGITTSALFKRNEVPEDFFGTHIHTNDLDSQTGADSREVGILREGRQLSDNWYAIAEREVIKASSTNVVNTYITYQNFTWPPVLSGIVVDRWTRRDGGADPVEYPIYKRGAYSGPTRVEVKVYWKDSAWTIGTTAAGSDSELALIKPMHPEPILFQSPLASVSVPPTLHKAFMIIASTGSDHPVYSYKGTTWAYNATNYTDWPDYLVVQDSQRPFRGGYLREKITAYIPKVGT